MCCRIHRSEDLIEGTEVADDAFTGGQFQPRIENKGCKYASVRE